MDGVASGRLLRSAPAQHPSLSPLIHHRRPALPPPPHCAVGQLAFDGRRNAEVYGAAAAGGPPRILGGGGAPVVQPAEFNALQRKLNEVRARCCAVLRALLCALCIALIEHFPGHADARLPVPPTMTPPLLPALAADHRNGGGGGAAHDAHS